jgi:hypothetical protein
LRGTPPHGPTRKKRIGGRRRDDSSRCIGVDNGSPRGEISARCCRVGRLSLLSRTGCCPSPGRAPMDTPLSRLAAQFEQGRADSGPPALTFVWRPLTCSPRRHQSTCVASGGPPRPHPQSMSTAKAPAGEAHGTNLQRADSACARQSGGPERERDESEGATSRRVETGRNLAQRPRERGRRRSSPPARQPCIARAVPPQGARDGRRAQRRAGSRQSPLAGHRCERTAPIPGDVAGGKAGAVHQTSRRPSA